MSMGSCSNPWVAAGVGAFEKQICFLSRGAVRETLSHQAILECTTGCKGGSIYDVHRHLARYGGVTSSCYDEPLDAWQVRPCPERSGRLMSCRRFYSREPTLAEAQALKGTWSATHSLTRVVSGPQAIQAALMLYGAVAARIEIYPDFVTYTGGIFRTQFKSSDRLGFHAVQLLGWSGDSADQWWIGENSWGPAWGENQMGEPCSSQCVGMQCGGECKDDPAWQDTNGFDCNWYRTYDPGCAIYPSAGQRVACPNTCKTCPATLKSGEMCGYFRLQRGVNSIGVESFASHGFVAGYSPRDSDLLLGTMCQDSTTWQDPSGYSCSWYADQDPSCDVLVDSGQKAFCPRTCGTCRVPDDLDDVGVPVTVRRPLGPPSGALHASVLMAGVAWWVVL